MKSWPLSNYPIFIALMLLAATSATLAIGHEKRAEELAVYAYYFLVMGVIIRFLELWMPENLLQRSRSSLMYNIDYIISYVVKLKGQRMLKLDGILKWLYIRMPDSYWAMMDTKMHISLYMKNALKSLDVDQRLAIMVNRPYTREQRLRRTRLEEKIAMISRVSRDTTVLLSVFFIISLIYGLMGNWYFVRGYLSNLVFLVLGFLTLYIFTKVHFD